ncbi:MAG TPA: isoprenylcysteine carboxylmethyltransferase family protein [Gaiellaceae bacterium]|nr:isoprenylcysteine carboxylmethyltransferase family protein [Gaiellaceae bacterium]
MTLEARRILLKASLVVLFLGFAYANLARWHETGRPVGLGAVLLEAFTAFLFIIRRAPLMTSARPLAWVSASLGAFAMLAARPVAHPDAGPFAALELLQLIGFAIVLVALGALGRSFGIVAANRGVRTAGLYSFVRHPAYTGYLVSYLGYVGENASIRNIALLAVGTAAQLVRIGEEERTLLLDQAYRAYLARVPRRLIPFVY